MNKKESTPPTVLTGKSDNSEELSSKVIRAQDYRKGFGFLALMALDFVVLTYYYMLLHGIDLFVLLRQPPTVLTFDYIGGSANAFSVGSEIVYWALMGVICQMAYLAGRTLIEGIFDFWKAIFGWIGTSLYAVGTAIAVIFSLKIVSINIADIKITLADAPIEVIIAISIILGFYSEESRRLLGRLRRQIVSGMTAEGEEHEKDKAHQ